jgi:hypothetical protein
MNIEKLIESAGYLESDNPKIKKALLLLKDIGDFVVIGGFALCHYTDKARQVTPDLDILMSLTSEGVKKLKLHAEHLSNNTAGVSMILGGFEVDLILPTTPDQRYAFNNSNNVGEVKITTPEGLFAMKAALSRDKDQTDLRHLIRKFPDKVKDFKTLVVKNLNVMEKEDFEQLVQWANLEKL